MFGVIIPGFPPVTQFTQTAQMQWILDITTPANHNTICFFLSAPIQDDYAAVLSFVTDEQNNFEFLGAIGNTKPSDVIHTGWSLNPAVNTLSQVRLIISLEPVQSILELVENTQHQDMRQLYAKKVALNLFRFMESFNQVGYNEGGVLVLPVDVLDKWMNKFEVKFKYDPNFVLKTE